jgi:DNA-binding response OmpR family regulator
MRVLLVEDEPHAALLLAKGLREQAYAVDVVTDGQQAAERAFVNTYDAIILDLMLPLRDGLSVCREIRARGELTPILVVTAMDAVESRIQGLDSGADDYLTKPFGVRELVARARALMRRVRPTGDATSPGADQPVVRLGPVTLDPARRVASMDGSDLELTPREFDLLYLLASHPGIVFSREALIARVWKGDTHVTERSVDTLVKRLRRKIERDAATPDWLLTVWGSGYKAADV